jgi:hypothetical protein
MISNNGPSSEEVIELSFVLSVVAEKTPTVATATYNCRAGQRRGLQY